MYDVFLCSLIQLGFEKERKSIGGCLGMGPKRAEREEKVCVVIVCCYDILWFSARF